MKQGKSLTKLAQELERQQSAKRDFLADTRELELVPSEVGAERLRLAANDPLEFTLTHHAHRQIGSFLNIPAKYYDRMQAEAPTLLAANVNYWFREQPTERMVRTLDGKARAFLSNRYRRLDNFELLHAVLPVLSELRNDMNKGLEVVSCEVTETKLYLKCVFPRIEAEVKKGDPVQSGIVISNSEVGLGSLSVTPLIFRLACENGMVAPDYGQRKYHVGRAATSEEGSYKLFSDETLQADDRAFWLKTRDVVRAAATPRTFERIVAVLQGSSREHITQPIQAAQELANHLNLNQGEMEAMLAHFLREADFSRWGLANAVTRSAQDVTDYDRATELEEAGWRTVTLGASDWRHIAQAA
jgi:hypothetical protein